MAKTKYVILLPLTYNDGSQIPKCVMDHIFDESFVLANGYYIAGVGQGAYRMRNGSKQVDQSLEVWVAVEEEDVPALKELVAKVAQMLDQESIYLERTGGSVEFIAPAAVGGKV